MMNLNEYIIYKDIQYNDDLYAHLCVDNNEYPINESRGIPDGLEDDASYLAKEVYNTIKKNGWQNCKISIDLSKLKLKDLFETFTVKVIITDDTIDGGFETRKRFNRNVLITLYIPKGSAILPIKSEISHELIHAYVYMINKTVSSSDLSKFFDRLSKISYGDISKWDTQEDNIRFIVYALMYFFNEDEVNAFVGQLQTELNELAPKNMKDAYKVLFNTTIYQTYLAVYNMYKNTKDFDKWCDVYREMNTGDKDLPNKKIKKKIHSRFEYIKKRLWKIIPRILKEGLWCGTIYHSPDNLLNKLKEFNKN